MQLHLPYLALREMTQHAEQYPANVWNRKPPRKLIDISFLNIPKRQVDAKFIVHEAQISLVICGSDETRWVGYAFVDTDFNAHDCSCGYYEQSNRDQQEEESGDRNGREHEEEEDVGDEDTDELQFNEDPIASDRRGNDVGTDHPIWNPREYFLRNVDFRMSQVLKEWIHLIRTVEASVEEWVGFLILTTQRKALTAPLESKASICHITKIRAQAS